MFLSIFSANGEVVYKADVPDTITSWIASAFAVNENSGLGVAPEPAKVDLISFTLAH